MNAWLRRPGLPRNGRIGLLLVALAGVVGALAPLAGDLVRGGSVADPEVSTVIGFSDATTTSLVLQGLIAFLIAVAAARITALWGQLLGLIVATVAAATFAITVVQARTSDRLSPDADVETLAGGQVLLLAALLAAAGIVTILIAVQGIAPLGADDPPPDDPRRQPTAGMVALVLGVAGMLIPLCPPLAIAVGGIAITDARARRPEGRKGAALIGVVAGALMLAVWSSLLIQAALSATPSASG